MRQFILENQIINNNLITLEGKDFRYLRQVLRCKVGDMINVRHQNGNLLETTVAKIDEKAHVVILQVCSDISQIEFQGTDFILTGHAGPSGFGTCTTTIPLKNATRMIEFEVYNGLVDKDGYTDQDLIDQLNALGWDYK